MNKKVIRIVLAILSAVLLLGSFPIRNIYGTMICDIMRIIGFILLAAYSIISIRGNKQ